MTAISNPPSTHTIPDQAIENLIPLWLVTIVFNVATVIIATPSIKHGITTHDPVGLFALAFPAAGLALLLLSLLRTLRVRKFGESLLHLSTYPLTPGSDLAGTIHVAHPLPTGALIHLRLLCIRRLRRSGPSTGGSESIIWQQRLTLDHLPPATPSSTAGADIPVLFHIPNDAQPSTGFAQTEILWRLQARCPSGIIRYFSRFQLPIILATHEQPPPPLSVHPEPPAHHVGVPDPRSRLREPGIICQPIGAAALHIHLAAARRKPIVPTIVGLICTAIALVLILAPAPDLTRIITIALGSFFLLIGALFDYIAIFLWVVSQDLTVRRGSLVREVRAPFFRMQRTFDVSDISEILCKIDGESGSADSSGQSTAATFHGIQLKTKTGKSLWLASDISSATYAAFLTDQIIQTLGLPEGDHSSTYPV